MRGERGETVHMMGQLIGLFRVLATSALLVAAGACTVNLPFMYPARAHQAIVAFFSLLSQEKYDQAAVLYGGDYTQLEVYAPEVDPGDRGRLWQNACEKSGLQCLPVASAAYLGSTGDVFTFLVQFRKPDGNVFALAPCCGEPGFLDTPRADFVYRVGLTPDGTFVVLDLPVYVP